MVINEELIAAYIDGDVTVEERDQVRKYLAQHPVEQDLVFSLMEDADVSDEDCLEQDAKASSQHKDSSFQGIAYAAAAFAPKVTLKAPEAKAQNRIAQRLGRMSAFLKEIEKEH